MTSHMIVAVQLSNANVEAHQQNENQELRLAPLVLPPVHEEVSHVHPDQRIAAGRHTHQTRRMRVRQHMAKRTTDDSAVEDGDHAQSPMKALQWHPSHKYNEAVHADVGEASVCPLVRDPAPGLPAVPVAVLIVDLHHSHAWDKTVETSQAQHEFAVSRVCNRSNEPQGETDRNLDGHENDSVFPEHSLLRLSVHFTLHACHHVVKIHVAISIDVEDASFLLLLLLSLSFSFLRFGISFRRFYFCGACPTFTFCGASFDV
mmetsp:Transcript_5078/g.9563  ORF Transcript_5078/g.9563 Transcript_5078/m.9563 type:complete len:260 (-) Transcript_5078:248-1027(-)